MKTEPTISAQYISQAILSRFTPIRYLNPQVLSVQLDNFSIGWIAMMALSWDAIERRDDVLKGVAGKRKKSVGKLKRESLVIDNSPEAARHKEALDEFYDNMTVVNALDENERGSQSLLFRQMMDACGKYYAVHEIVWQPGGPSKSGGDLLTAELRFAPLWFFENRTGKLRFLPFVGSGEGQPMEEGGWMVTKGDGLMEACCVAWMFKHLPLKDWLVYSEKFGIPPVIGRTAASPESEAGKSMARAVAAWGNEFATVIYGDDGSGKIEVSDVSKASGNLPFPGLIERMDRAMCALWRGNDLSTMSADNKGASVQDDESDLLLEDDAEMISETLRIYIDRQVIWQKFGTTTCLAKSQLVVPKKAQELDLKIDAFLVNSGAELGERERLEHYGRPRMAPDDKPLKKAVPVTERITEQEKPGAAPDDLPNNRSHGSHRAYSQNDTRAALHQLFANAASRVDPATASLIARASDAIGKATAADLVPLTSRIEALLAVDDAAFVNEFASLIADRSKIAKQIFKNTDAATAFEEALGAALVNGLVFNPTEMANEVLPGNSEYLPCPKCHAKNMWPGPKGKYPQVKYRGSIECWDCGHTMSGIKHHK